MNEFWVVRGWNVFIHIAHHFVTKAAAKIKFNKATNWCWGLNIIRNACNCNVPDQQKIFFQVGKSRIKIISIGRVASRELLLLLMVAHTADHFVCLKKKNYQACVNKYKRESEWKQMAASREKQKQSKAINV